MDQLELERWLCDYALTPTPPAVVATALGLPAGKLADSTLLRVASRVRALRLERRRWRVMFEAPP